MKYLLTIAIALCGAACAPKQVHFTWQGPDQDYPAAVEAAAQWNKCPGVQLDVTPDQGGITITPVPYIVKGGQFYQGITHFNDLHEPTWINYVPSDDHVASVLAHEMGHVLGKDHVNDPSDVMYGANTTGVVRMEDCP